MEQLKKIPGDHLFGLLASAILHTHTLFGAKNGIKITQDGKPVELKKRKTDELNNYLKSLTADEHGMVFEHHLVEGLKLSVPNGDLPCTPNAGEYSDYNITVGVVGVPSDRDTYYIIVSFIDPNPQIIAHDDGLTVTKRMQWGITPITYQYTYNTTFEETLEDALND